MKTLVKLSLFVLILNCTSKHEAERRSSLEDLVNIEENNKRIYLESILAEGLSLIEKDFNTGYSTQGALTGNLVLKYSFNKYDFKLKSEKAIEGEAIIHNTVISGVEYCLNYIKSSNIDILEDKSLLKIEDFECSQESWVLYNEVVKEIIFSEDEELILNILARKLIDSDTYEYYVYNRAYIKGSSVFIEPSTCTEFAEILNSTSNRSFILKKDLDCEGIDLTNAITEQDNLYLYGNGYEIKNYNIASSGTNRLALIPELTNSYVSNIKVRGVSIIGQDTLGALFAYVNGSVIEYVEIAEVFIEGRDILGSLLGEVNNSSIYDVSSKEIEIEGKGYLSLLLGYVYNTELELMYASGIVKGYLGYKMIYLGGLVGVLNISSLINSEVEVAFIDAGEEVGGVVGSVINNSILSRVELSLNEIAGENYVGGVVGTLIDSELSYISSTAKVYGTNYVGGLIAYSENSIISQVESKGILIQGNDYVGGLIGYQDCQVLSNEELSLSNSSYEGYVKGNNYVGGLIGSTNYCKIETSNAKGNIEGGGVVGGLIGKGFRSRVYSSSTDVEIYSTCGYVGGLAGEFKGSTWPNSKNPYGDAIIEESYSLGSILVEQDVSCYYKSFVGGLVGFLVAANISNSYSKSNVESNTNCVGGFFGISYFSLTEKSYAKGSVIGLLDVGSFGGTLDCIDGSSDIGVLNSYATGSAHGISPSFNSGVGAFIGYSSFSCQVRKSYAVGTATGVGSAKVSGFIGSGTEPRPNVTDCYSKQLDIKVTHYPEEIDWSIEANFNFDFNNTWFMNSENVLPPAPDDFIRPHLFYELDNAYHTYYTKIKY